MRSERMIETGRYMRMEITTNPKPWWMPGFVWSRIVKLVIKDQKFSTEFHYSDYAE